MPNCVYRKHHGFSETIGSREAARTNDISLQIKQLSSDVQLEFVAMIGIRNGNIWVFNNEIAADQDLRNCRSKLLGSRLDEAPQSDIGLLGCPIRDANRMTRGDDETDFLPHITIFASEHKCDMRIVEDVAAKLGVAMVKQAPPHLGEHDERDLEAMRNTCCRTLWVGNTWRHGHQ